MKKHKTWFAGIPFALYLVVIFFLFSNSLKIKNIGLGTLTVKNGVAKIQKEYLQECFFVGGEFLFAKNEFLKTFEGFSKNTVVEFPDFIPNDIISNGYASLGLKMIGLKPYNEYAIHFSNIKSAFQVIINGKVVSFVGKATKTKTAELPKRDEANCIFEADSNGEVEIILWISNFHNSKMGTNLPILAGDVQKVQKTLIADSIVTMVHIGVFLTSVFIFSLFYFFRPIENYFLGFASLCLLIAIRLFCYEPFLIHNFFPNISWQMHFKISYLTFSLSVICILRFTYSLFRIRNKILSYAIYSATVIYTVIIIICDPIITNDLLKYFSIVAGVMVVYVTGIAIVAVKRKKQGAVWVLIASLAFEIMLLHDFIVFPGSKSGTSFVQHGILMYIFVLMLMVVYRYFYSFESIKKIKNKIEQRNAALSKFVPPEILTELGKPDFSSANYGDFVEKDITILVSDIRAFTTISEKLNSDEVFMLLNKYLSLVAPVIREHNGFVIQYMGDGYTAVFYSAEDALKSAITILNLLKQDNMFSEKVPELQAGFGIASGMTLLGITGDNIHMESCIHSPTVKLATKLENETKKYSSNILVSANAGSRLKEEKSKLTNFLKKIEGKFDEQIIYEVSNLVLSEYD